MMRRRNVVYIGGLIISLVLAVNQIYISRHDANIEPSSWKLPPGMILVHQDHFGELASLADLQNRTLSQMQIQYKEKYLESQSAAKLRGKRATETHEEITLFEKPETSKKAILESKVQEQERLDQTLQRQEKLNSIQSPGENLQRQQIDTKKRDNALFKESSKEEGEIVEHDISTNPTDSGNWLVIGIPTVPRLHELDYLITTLTSLNEQIGHQPFDLKAGRNSLLTDKDNLELTKLSKELKTVKILVIVMNVSSLTHKRFMEAKQKFKDSRFIEFLEHEDEPPKMKQPSSTKNRNIPNAKVMKQTRDLVALMRVAGGRGKYFMFMEDDFVLCPLALLAILHYIKKATARSQNWIAIRSSYGMNGIVMQDRDLSVFADYMEQHQARRPPDHLVVEWFAGETDQSANYKKGRPNMAFRWNLFDHIGTTSSLRAQVSPPYPICYEELNDKILFKVEAFDQKACPSDDVWPCGGKVSKQQNSDSSYVFNGFVLFDKETKDRQNKEWKQYKQNKENNK